MKPEGIKVVKRALTYLENTYGAGPGTLPHDHAHLYGHAKLMCLLPESALVEYIQERGQLCATTSEGKLFGMVSFDLRKDPRFYITPSDEVFLKSKLQ